MSIFSTGRPELLSGVKVDQVLMQAHSKTAKVTDFAVETGARLSDHIITIPESVSISFVIENYDGFLQNPYGTRAATELQKLYDIMNARTLVDVVTRHVKYTSMAITDISSDTSAPLSGRLTAQVSFKKFNEVVVDSVEVPESQVANGSQGASSNQDGGRQEPDQVSDEDKGSLANQIANNFF